MKRLKQRLNRLVSQVAKHEGKKSQVTAGNIREVLRVLATIEAKDFLKDKWSTKGPCCTLAMYSDYVRLNMNKTNKTKRKKNGKKK